MEVIFAIFYLSGIIKSFLIFYKIPFIVDFTLFAAFLVIIAVFIEFKNKKIPIVFNKNNLLAFVFLLIFYLWMIISLIWTPSNNYSFKKVFFFLPNIISFGFPLIYKRFDIAKFFRIISIALIIVSIVFLKIYLDYSADKISRAYYQPILGLYLTCSSLMGINILVILGAKKKVFKNLFISSFVVTLSIILMFLLGARGPLIFVLLLLIPLLFIKFFKLSYFKILLSSDFRKVLFSGFTILFFLTFSLIFENEVKVLLDRSAYRLGLLLPLPESETNSLQKQAGSEGSAMGKSVDLRVDQLRFSTNLLKQNKLESIYGFGIGSFGLLYYAKDFRSYPHNIFLEIWIELGLIGLILFLIFLYFIFTKNLNGVNYINILVLMYIILNVLKSSSFIDIRIFMAVFAFYMLDSNDKYLNKNENNIILKTS
ncbi:MAG: O-antigen ligase family protein [Bacteroidales bacterium]|nr:O-antigen ligase family protein [Bacteroidales bacterium]MCK9499067.1 O-antigen ligase family protein [Bacteroidales bacterium]MDY0315123.1 O-antigen ligase family protein [Bacteroidales bacterium]